MKFRPIITAIITALGCSAALSAQDISPRDAGRLASDMVLCIWYGANSNEETQMLFLDIQAALALTFADSTEDLPAEFHEGMESSRNAIRAYHSSGSNPEEAMKKRFTPAFCAQTFEEIKRQLPADIRSDFELP